MIYAQLDSTNVCIGISQLSGEVQSEDMIKIDSYDTSFLGKKYNNGLWEEVLQNIPNSIKIEPSNSDVLQTVNNLIADLTIAGVI